MTTVTSGGDGWESSQSYSYDDGSDPNSTSGSEQGGVNKEGDMLANSQLDPNQAIENFQQQFPTPLGSEGSSMMDGAVDPQKALEDFLAGGQQGSFNPFGGQNSAIQGNGGDPTSQGCSGDQTFGAENGSNFGVQDAAIPATSSPNAMFA